MITEIGLGFIQEEAFAIAHEADAATWDRLVADPTSPEVRGTIVADTIDGS
jgi:hypothetical protein